MVSVKVSHIVRLIVANRSQNNNNIYAMTFSLHQGGVVVSSQITHTQTVIKIHPLAHILDT